MKVITDNWNGNRNEAFTFETENFDEVENALGKLNQKTHTQLILEGEDSYLLAGGGNHNYVVTLTIGEDEKFLNLLNPSKKEDETGVDLVTGGQLGTFPSKMVVSNEIAIEALRHYFKNEEENPNLLWEED